MRTTESFEGDLCVSLREREGRHDAQPPPPSTDWVRLARPAGSVAACTLNRSEVVDR
jgi:hypothetical protein